MFGLFPREAISHNSTVLSGCYCQYSHLIKSLWHKWPATLICYPPCCIDSPSRKRLFEGCWSPIYICSTFVLIKCSHSMEIGYLTKWLEPAVMRLIAVTVAAIVPYGSIFRVAGYWIKKKSKSTDKITWWNLMADCFLQQSVRTSVRTNAFFTIGKFWKLSKKKTLIVSKWAFYIFKKGIVGLTNPALLDVL